MPSELPRLVTRVPIDVNNKFLAICINEDRTASNLLAHIVKNYITEYEAKNGEFIVGEDGNITIAKPKAIEGRLSNSKIG